MKQINIVLDAVKQGARTSIEVEAVTGLPIKHSSHWLGELWRMGIIERVGRRRYRAVGIAAFEYRLATPSSFRKER